MATLASNRAETRAARDLDRPTAVSYPITLTSRGITRQTTDICDFPPLRVDFTAPAPTGSLFEHQKNLKLVTHCRRDAAFQQKLLLEYSAYRLFNLMTPQSFRARLANIDYLDAAAGPTSREWAISSRNSATSPSATGWRPRMSRTRSRGSARSRRERSLCGVRIYDQQLRLVDARRAERQGMLPQRRLLDPGAGAG